ncbi:MAG: DUF4349 domain-containing protein [Dehalococcoidia bacterium]
MGIIGAVALLTSFALALAGCTDDNESTSDSAPSVGVASPGVDDSEKPAEDRAQAEGGASVVASGGAPLGEAPAADPGLQVIDRKIIQSTSVDVGVEDVARNFQEVLRIADAEAGHIVSSSLTNVDDEQAGDVTIRVPHDRYQGVLASIRLMGDVVTETSEGNDVTEEFTDLQARLRTLGATEQRYLDLLAAANGIEEILMVQDRLDGVRGQIEQVQGRVNLLNGLTDMSTITVHLRLPEAGASSGGGGAHPLRAAQAAWDASLDALRGVTTAVVVVAVFSWWLVPVFVALAIGARWWNRRPQPPVAPPIA